MLEYKGLKGVYECLAVSDSQVDRQVDALLEQNTRAIPVTDRPSREGDELLLDYAGFCDGVQFEGGTAQNQTLVLGSGTFIPGFEAQLVGKLPGDSVDVKVTFPMASLWVTITIVLPYFLLSSSNSTSISLEVL